MTTYMAECFWPGVTEQLLADAGARAGRATEAMSVDGVRAHYLGSILVPADEIALCLIEASSLEAASDLNRRAGIPFERILEVVRLEPHSLPGHSSSSPDHSTTSAKELR
jgi:hypothetical protein